MVQQFEADFALSHVATKHDVKPSVPEGRAHCSQRKHALASAELRRGLLIVLGDVLRAGGFRTCAVAGASEPASAQADANLGCVM